MLKSIFRRMCINALIRIILARVYLDVRDYL